MRTLFCLAMLGASRILWAASAGSQPVTSVTVLLTYEQPHTLRSFEALQQQLQSVLDKAGLKLDVRERGSAKPHEEFPAVVLFKMRGTCSMNVLPVGALSDERGPLAMAYTADANILPFGEVECDHVRHSLQLIVGRWNANAYESAFGAALGMIMAHEIYHMLAHSPEHTKHGVTKESLSSRDLLEGSLSMPEIARLAIRQSQNGSR